MNIGDPRNVPRLPGVAGDSVQNEQIAPGKLYASQKKKDDLFRKGEMLVLEQEPMLKDAVDDAELLARVGRGPLPAGNCPAQFRAEVEMVAGTVEQAAPGDRVSQGGFPATGGTEEQQGVDGSGTEVR